MAVLREVRLPATVHLLDGTEVTEVDLVIPLHGDLGSLTTEPEHTAPLTITVDIQAMRIEPRQ